MDFGASMFMTDYCIPAADLGRALEERGFESLWNPEHSHIPTSRKTPFPGGGDVPKMYYDAMDPFITLTAAAVATKNLKLGTGVCLVIQRDTIQTAKPSLRSTRFPAAASFGSAAAGTRTRWRTTARSTRPASSRCASRSRR